jgi:hypothetical protein
MSGPPDVDALLQKLARAYRESAQAANTQAAAARDRAHILRRLAALSAELAAHSCDALAVASRCAGEAATREAQVLELMARVNDTQAARARAQSQAALARRQLQGDDGRRARADGGTRAHPEPSAVGPPKDARPRHRRPRHRA